VTFHENIFFDGFGHIRFPWLVLMVNTNQCKETSMSQRLNYAELSPILTKKLLELGQAMSTSTIDQSLQDLVNIRASQINGCGFCLDMHVKEAKIHGERELRVYHVSIWQESTLFSNKERAAFEWTEAVTEIAGSPVPDETYNRVRQHLSEKEISDLTYAIGIINMWNRLSVSFRSVPGSLDAMFGLNKAGLS